LDQKERSERVCRFILSRKRQNGGKKVRDRKALGNLFPEKGTEQRSGPGGRACPEITKEGKNFSSPRTCLLSRTVGYQPHGLKRSEMGLGPRAQGKRRGNLAAKKKRKEETYRESGGGGREGWGLPVERRRMGGHEKKTDSAATFNRTAFSSLRGDGRRIPSTLSKHLSLNWDSRRPLDSGRANEEGDHHLRASSNEGPRERRSRSQYP